MLRGLKDKCHGLSVTRGLFWKTHGTTGLQQQDFSSPLLSWTLIHPLFLSVFLHISSFFSHIHFPFTSFQLHNYYIFFTISLFIYFCIFYLILDNSWRSASRVCSRVRYVKFEGHPSTTWPQKGNINMFMSDSMPNIGEIFGGEMSLLF